MVKFAMFQIQVERVAAVSIVASGVLFVCFCIVDLVTTKSGFFIHVNRNAQVQVWVAPLPFQSCVGAC